MLDLLVVGGGVSGLTLAREVAAHAPDWSVAVLEAGGRPGGTMRSERVDGCLCEWGPNGFLTNVPHTWDLANELGLGPRLRVADARSKRRFLWVRGALKEISPNPLRFLGSDLLSVRGRARLLLEPFMPRGKPGADDSIRTFASRRIGGEAADLLVDAMVTGIFAGDPSRLSLAAALPRMAAMEDRYRSLMVAMLAKTLGSGKTNARGDGSRGGPAGPGGSLVSFDEGMEVLIRALAREVGDRLRIGVTVTGIESHGNAFRVHTKQTGGAATGSGTTNELLARRVVLATPAHVATRVLAPEFGEITSLLQSIPYAPIAVVCLIHERSQVAHDLQGFGFLVPQGQQARILGCIWTGSVFPDHVAPDRVMLRAMVGGARDPDGAGLPEGELIDAVRADLGRILGGLKGEPTAVRVYRWSKGIPQYVVGHLAKLEDLDRKLAEHPGLHVAGNAYRGVAVNDCVRNSRELARRIVTE